MALPPMGPLFAPGGGASFSTPDATQPMSPGLGKNSRQQGLASPHSGLKQQLTKGDPMSRAMSQYGKGHSFNAPLKQIRGGQGNMKRIRGGLGPGREGQPGPATDYSMTSPDTE